MRLIDADRTKESIPETSVDIFENCARCGLLDREQVFDLIDEQPTIDAVPVGAYEQTRWERDMAISQLAEIGKSLCEKMDNVATVVRCKDCKWWREETDHTCRKWGGASPRNANGYCDDGERSEE